MLATETQAISNFLKGVMLEKFGAKNSKDHMADTRDTLCYATNENQDSTYGLLKTKADLAIVVGGYNSSNTSHLVELCEEKLPTYFISNESEIKSATEIKHFDFENKKLLKSINYLPEKEVIDIILTSGASCPDTVVENVLKKILDYFPTALSTDEILSQLEKTD
jgi:4-hydroxy-3-methylbut-2-enyl diphosphate reductase